MRLLLLLQLMNTIRTWETARLVAWKNPTQVLGWARKETPHRVRIGWGPDDEGIPVELPQPDPASETSDELSRSLWPSGIAGAILCRSPALSKFQTGLELGAGLGLAGWTAAGSSLQSMILTDHDTQAVELLQEQSTKNLGKCQTRELEWRDADPDLGTFDLVLGTDVAYYWYLLRPLMDTIRRHLAGTCLVVGQANRESQWDLFDNIRKGCYNQLTDEHEGPWSGQTKAILYELRMGEDYGEVVPICVLMHSLDENFAFSEHDFVADEQARSEIQISF